MRDALSLLDQVLSFAERAITPADVTRVLGLIGDELYLDLFAILADRRAGDVFRFVQRILDDGYDLTEFYRGLTDALRTLLIWKFDGAETAQVRDDLRARYAEIAARFDAPDLLRMLALAAEIDTEGRFRKSANPRIMLEVLLLRFAYLDRTVSFEELLRAAGGAPPPDTAPRPPGPESPGSEAPAAARQADRGAETSARAGTRPAPASAAAPARPGVPAVPAADAAAAPLTEPTAGARFASATEAFRGLLEERTSIPNGLGIFLKAARADEPAPGNVILRVPPGPGFEQLTGDSPAARSLQDALCRALARPIRLSVEPAAADRNAGQQRLTPEQVRADRLARLTREQPLLACAVEAWDLELVD
jgi:DNA polymerase-3 subunit gamma/tau